MQKILLCKITSHKIMKKLLLLIIIGTITITSFAQKLGTITGAVADKAQNLSLPGANLKLTPGKFYTVSDQFGKFQFMNVPFGEYTITVNYLGYQSYSQKVNLTYSTAVVNIALEDGALVGKEVIILGDRLRGQAKALNQQKTNKNITNIVSADQVGRFPDANIGDAMKRIPGVTMQNDQGEARDIIIRGLAPELNSVTLNGDRIPSAEGDNRRVQLDLIPSDMIQSIEVNKTLTSDMDADAIGGSVNLVTRAAPNGQRISVTAAGGFNPIRNSPIATGSLVYGNRFADKKLGVVFSASYNNNNFGSDNIEAIWTKDKYNNVFIREHDIRVYDLQRIRRSFSLATDYKFNAKNNISISGMYNWRDDFENRFRTRFTSIVPVYANATSPTIINFRGRGRNQLKGGSANVKNRRLESQTVKNISARGEHLLFPKLNLDWALSYSDAIEDRPEERLNEFQTGTRDIQLQLADAEFPQANSAGITNANFNFRNLTENFIYTEESEIGAKLNFKTPLTLIANQKGRLRFGARLRLKDKLRDNFIYGYTPKTAPGTLADRELLNLTGNDFVPGSQFNLGSYVTPKSLGSLNLKDPSLFTEAPVPADFLAVNYTAKENIAATYLRLDQDINDKLSFIAGLRLENTSLEYTGNIVSGQTNLLGQKTNKNSYLNVLPSVSFMYSAKENLIFRAAYTTSLARPNYYDLVPYFNSVPGDLALSVGNSNLKAAFAHNLDFMVENYFKSVGLISGGFFYKKINNFIYTFRDLQYSNAKFTADFPETTNPIPVTEQWQYTQRRNGSSVDLFGFEIAFQRQLDFLPGFLNGFGIYTNYTYTKSNAKGVFSNTGTLRTDVALPGTAPHLFNASLSYETKKLVMRVSYNYTAAYLDDLGGESFGDRFYDKQAFLDANASYKFTKKTRFFAEANNLTNQALRYYQGIPSRTAQLEFYRPRYNFGLKFDM